MQITWRERLMQRPSLKQYRTWPSVAIDSIVPRYRKKFMRNIQIVQAVLEDKPIKCVAQLFSVSPGRITQLLDRAMGGEEQSSPLLNRGLIPYAVIVVKSRHSSLPRSNNEHASCAFTLLLKQLPALSTALDDMIKAALNDKAYSQRMKASSLHGEFKRVLAAANWPRDTYPYTHPTLAYSSVRRYGLQRTDELLQQKQESLNCKTRTYSFTAEIVQALDAIQIDEHSVDVGCRIHLLLNDRLIPLRLGRISVLVAVDVGTECILGYYLTPTAAPTHQDMLALLDACITPWSPLDLQTPGLRYLEGAAFPSSLSCSVPLSFGSVSLDNALMHRAKAIKSVFTDQFGACLDYGRPAMPKVRCLVESCFDYFEREAGHLFASTTGSHPHDPIKESAKNARIPPIITFQTLNEVFSVMFTDYNQTSKTGTGGASPLDLFAYQCANNYIRYVPQVVRKQQDLFRGSKEVALHWYHHENRLPHINFAHARYQGAGLLDVVNREKRVRITLDHRDVRTLSATTLDGRALGELKVSGGWGKYPHSLAMRNQIYNYVRTYKLGMRNPLSDYFYHLLKSFGTLKGASSLLKVYTEFTQGGNQLILQQSQPILPESSSSVWTPNIANHKR